MELRPFVDAALAGLARTVHLAPAGTDAVLERMRVENWLGSYETLEGVELTLHRISRRLSPRARGVIRPDRAREFLAANHAGLQVQFDVLWRDLSASVAEFRAQPMQNPDDEHHAGAPEIERMIAAISRAETKR